MHSHNPLVYFAWRFTLKLLFFFICLRHQPKHTQPSDTILSSFVVRTCESPFTGPQEEGIYAKQAQCTNLTSTFTYTVRSDLHTFYASSLQSCPGQKHANYYSNTSLLSIYANFKFAWNKFCPRQKIISFFASPYFLSHTCTRATIRHTRAQQHVVTDKLWEVGAIKNMSKLETRRQYDSCGGTSQHHRTFICK